MIRSATPPARREKPIVVIRQQHLHAIPLRRLWTAAGTGLLPGGEVPHPLRHLPRRRPWRIVYRNEDRIFSDGLPPERPEGRADKSRRLCSGVASDLWRGGAR